MEAVQYQIQEHLVSLTRNKYTEGHLGRSGDKL